MQNQNEKVWAAGISVASNSVLVILKIIIGIFIGSVSVISEAIHSAVDLIASLIALIAVRESSKPADKLHPYGHGKIENISGTVEAILIFFAAIWIIYESIQKLLHPSLLKETHWGVGVMLASALVNFFVSQYLFKVGKKTDSVALEADAWHLRTDVYASLGVMLALGIIWGAEKFYPTLNISWIDPVAAILVAGLILHAAWELTVKAARDLFDVSLPEEEVLRIKELIFTEKEVRGIHEFKTRKAGNFRFVEFHMELDSLMPLNRADQLAHKVEKLLQKEFEGIVVTVHLDPVLPLDV